jgi:hypothetical protein
VEVNSRLGLGSDHLLITYELELGRIVIESNCFRPDAMDTEKFLSILRRELDPPVPNITTQEELDEATDSLCDALILALNSSTPKRRPSSHSKKWWTAELTVLVADVKRKECWFHRHLAPITKQAWLDARRTLYQVIWDAKERAWRAFVGDLSRVNVYDVLDHVRRRHRSVFPSLVDPETGNVEVGHMERGRVEEVTDETGNKASATKDEDNKKKKNKNENRKRNNNEHNYNNNENTNEDRADDSGRISGDEDGTVEREREETRAEELEARKRREDLVAGLKVADDAKAWR